MKIAADTNILVRGVVRDDEEQARRVDEAFESAFLIAIDKVATHRPAVEAGLAILGSGGDFADGVIAHEGAWLGGEIFLSFDKHAVSLLNGHGVDARLP